MELFHKMDGVLLAAQAKFKKFLYEENGDVNIVSMVVLIGIAVVLAVTFKDSITKLIKSLLKTITNKAKEAVK